MSPDSLAQMQHAAWRMIAEAIDAGYDGVEPTRRRVQFPGIATHAEALGVSRQHLYYVLSGARQSPQLAARYRALLRDEGGKAK